MLALDLSIEGKKVKKNARGKVHNQKQLSEH